MENGIQVLQSKLGVTATGAYDAETHAAHLKTLGCVACPDTLTGWEALLRGSFKGFAPAIIDALEEAALTFVGTLVVASKPVATPIRLVVDPSPAVDETAPESVPDVVETKKDKKPRTRR